MNNSKGADECCICFKEFDSQSQCDRISLICGHNDFCNSCLDRSISPGKSFSCPICQQKTFPSNCMRFILINGEEYFINCDRKQRISLVKDLVKAVIKWVGPLRFFYRLPPGLKRYPSEVIKWPDCIEIHDEFSLFSAGVPEGSTIHVIYGSSDMALYRRFLLCKSLEENTASYQEFLLWKIQMEIET